MKLIYIVLKTIVILPELVLRMALSTHFRDIS